MNPVTAIPFALLCRTPVLRGAVDASANFSVIGRPEGILLAYTGNAVCPRGVRSPGIFPRRAYPTSSERLSRHLIVRSVLNRQNSCGRCFEIPAHEAWSTLPILISSVGSAVCFPSRRVASKFSFKGASRGAGAIDQLLRGVAQAGIGRQPAQVQQQIVADPINF